MEVTQIYRKLTDEEISSYKTMSEKLVNNLNSATDNDKIVYKGLIREIDTIMSRGTINTKIFEYADNLAKKIIKEHPKLAKGATDMTLSSAEKLLEWVDKQQI